MKEMIVKTTELRPGDKILGCRENSYAIFTEWRDVMVIEQPKKHGSRSSARCYYAADCRFNKGVDQPNDFEFEIERPEVEPTNVVMQAKNIRAGILVALLGEGEAGRTSAEHHINVPLMIRSRVGSPGVRPGDWCIVAIADLLAPEPVLDTEALLEASLKTILKRSFDDVERKVFAEFNARTKAEDDAQLLVRYEMHQRNDAQRNAAHLTVAELARAKELWSAALKTKVEASKKADAERDRLQVVVAIDPDDI